MKLLVNIDSTTKKRGWDRRSCDGCTHRFTCFSGNEIIVESDTLNSTVIPTTSRRRLKRVEVIASFPIPSCVRVGLFKQLGQDEHFGRFKLGKVLDPKFDISHVTVKLKPPTIEVCGHTWSVGVNGST